MSSIKTTQIDGDVSVGRNVAMGGNANISGGMRIGHDLKVDGWLEARNIKDVNKGVFVSVEALEEKYPEPRDGWFAGVGTSTPFTAYVGRNKEWVATGGVINVNVEVEEILEELADINEELDKIEGFSSADYFNACIKGISVNDTNVAQEGDKYYIGRLFRNAAALQFDIYKGETRVAVYWTDNASIVSNPPAYLDIPQHNSSGVTARVLIDWEQVKKSTEDLFPASPYELPNSCITHNADGATSPLLRKEFEKRDNDISDVSNREKQDISVLKQELSGYVGTEKSKGLGDSYLFIDVADTTDEDYHSQNIKIQLLPIPEGEYTLRIMQYPGDIVEPGSEIYPDSRNYDSVNGIVSLKLNAACNVIRITKWEDNSNVIIDSVMLYRKDKDSVKARVDVLETGVSSIEDAIDENFMPLALNNVVKGEVVPIQGGQYIKFNIDGVNIVRGKDALFYVKPNTTILLQMRTDSAAVAEYSITSDSKGKLLLSGNRLNNENYTQIWFRNYIGTASLVAPSITEIRSDVAEIKRYKGLYITSFGNGYVLEDNVVYEQCKFVNTEPAPTDGYSWHCSHKAVVMGNGTHLKDCHFVNVILLGGDKIVRDSSVERCLFIGMNSRISFKYAERVNILYNEFPISSSLYPSAVSRTKGEQSRNIQFATMNDCRIIGNHIYCGRTGILSLGDISDIWSSLSPKISSERNVISQNQIDGIGEEHISFDGSTTYDIGETSDAPFEYEYAVEDTGQMTADDGILEVAQQQKTVVLVTAHCKSKVAGMRGFKENSSASGYPARSGENNPNHIRNWSVNGRGFYVVNAASGYEAEVVSIVLEGTVVDESEGAGGSYSSTNEYAVTFKIPTSHFTQRLKNSPHNPITSSEYASLRASIEADIESKFSGILFVGGIQRCNVIECNSISGIGTDLANASDVMGGIVLYGMGIKNSITGNVLHQKRIWMQGWNVQNAFLSKLKMQCFNAICNNVISEGDISIVYYTQHADGDTTETGELIVGLKPNIGNSLTNNICTGSYGMGEIVLHRSKNTTMIGNRIDVWTLSENENLLCSCNSNKAGGRIDDIGTVHNSAMISLCSTLNANSGFVAAIGGTLVYNSASNTFSIVTANP